jgi:phage shock protein A
MFKQILTLMRGRIFEAEQQFVDRNALPLLAQQIREAGDAIQAARRAVAVAIAQNQQEEAQHRVLLVRVRDLESRTVAALEQGKDALAREAAEAIALLEAECETSEKAQAQFSAEISKLQAVVRASEARLRDLKRGERLARATDSAQRLNHTAAGDGNSLSTLRDAEETLERLRRRQQQIDLTSAVLAEIDGATDPTAMIGKLAEAGCGTPLRTNADDVLARLKARMNNAA